MRDDYLWDGSGAPDPEVRRLEELLGRYRHRPASLGQGSRGVHRTPSWRRWLPAAAAAAAAVLLGGVLVAWLALGGSRSGWEVQPLAGVPRVGTRSLGGPDTLPVGSWLTTDAGSRARIRIGAIGEAQVEPGSRVRLVRAELTDHRLALARGTLHATIWAPPRLFFVEVPSATAVDLGCAYTLSVDDGGAGLLRVTAGWVALDARGREAFVPAGARCATRSGRGPGTPCFEDATPALRTALDRLDFGRPVTASSAAASERGPTSAARAGPESPADERARALDVVLAEARSRDALTLWHLLQRSTGEERARIHDRLAALVPPPPGVTREGVLRGDRTMIDRWWDALGLGVSTWWRLWKNADPPGAG